MSRLNELLSQKGVLLADGATGTNLFNAGLVSGDAPELWNDEQPEKITALHQSFVDAGSDIILTNTFGGNAARLKLHDAQDRVFELNEKAAKIARAVVDDCGRDALVAGSVGPTGELFEPLGAMTHADAVSMFADQMEGLKSGGVDLLWIETMSAREEILAAAEAAQRVGMDYVFTASFDTAGRTMMGIAPADFARIADGLERRPVAVGANCGVGATDLLFSVLDMTDVSPIVVIAKANCGIPRVSGDKVVYTGTPDLMAQYARLAIDAGASIIGGCCGTAPEHIAAMRKAIDGHERGTRPSHEAIVSATGELVNKIATGPKQEPLDDRRGQRRGRRRG